VHLVVLADGCRRIGGAGVAHIATQWPNLKELSLFASASETAQAVSALHHLNSLTLDSTRGVLTTEAVVQIFRGCGELRSLTVCECSCCSQLVVWLCVYTGMYVCVYAGVHVTCAYIQQQLYVNMCAIVRVCTLRVCVVCESFPSWV
jgi:hypothetical protein